MEKRTLIIVLHGFLGLPRDWKSFLRHYLNQNFNQIQDQDGHQYQDSSLDIGLRSDNFQIIAPSLFQEGIWSPRNDFLTWGDLFLSQCKKWHNSGFEIKLFGYSLGGRLALGPYLKAPELFSEAHFLSVNPGLLNLNEIKERELSDQKWAKRFLYDPWDKLLSDWNAQPVFTGDNEPIRNQNDFNRELLSLSLTEWSLSKQPNYRDRLLSLNNNITWWVGDRDSKFLKIGQQLHAANSKIQLKIIPNCGHRILQI